MSPEDLDLAAAFRAILRHPLVRAEVRAIVGEAQPAPVVESYIGTAEAARRVGVKGDTILAWIERGTLPATRLPGAKAWRIKPSDLEAALAGRLDAGASPALPDPAPVDLKAKRSERARRLAEAVKGRPRE